MADVFLELVIDAGAANEAGLDSRDLIEDPLEEALEDAGLGQITGGGGGLGKMIIDIEVPADKFDESLALMRRVLAELGVPKNTEFQRYEPSKIIYPVYGRN